MMMKRFGPVQAALFLAALSVLPLGAFPASAQTAAEESDDVERGIAEWQAGDYRAAVMTWLPAAARGNAHALFNLGLAHRQGRGVPQDMGKAEDFFRRAAAKGHAPARTYVGIFLAKRGETAEAINLWQQSAREGDPYARYMLGVRYFNGKDLKKDVPRAYGYMLVASNAGLTQAGKALRRMDELVSPEERQAGERIAAQLSAPGTPAPAAGTPGAPAIANVPVPAPRPQASTASASSSRGRPAAATAGDYRVQLGAFSRRELAEAGWKAMQARHPAVLSGLSPVYAQFEGGYRLQVGGFPARGGAASLCARIQDAGQPCFVAATN